MTPSAKAPLAITMGDAVGIGPEIVAKAFLAGAAEGGFVVGDVGVMRRAAHALNAMLPVIAIEQPRDVQLLPPRCVPVWQVPVLPQGLAELPMGRLDARAGAAAAACIRQAAAFALRGEVAGIVTAPIHKEALAAAGVPFPGHTELLQTLCADECGMPPVRMMLANDELRTVLVTIHMSLRDALEAVTFDAVLETLRITHAALLRMGFASPRIAVAGLNPHAGEGGQFGREEIDVIAPAMQAASAQGIESQGPFPPDTVFMRARHTPDHPGEFDAVVAMTHDQGLIPVKYLGMDQGVNVTLGLPFIRTSPDHGTAFDIAGLGRANPASLAAAVRMARRLIASPAS